MSAQIIDGIEQYSVEPTWSKNDVVIQKARIDSVTVQRYISLFRMRTINLST